MRRIFTIPVLAVLVGLFGLLGQGDSRLVASNAPGGVGVAQVPDQAPQTREVILLDG
ncbi:MAG: hypothetical protein DK306_000312 [Chloroflexi bacterium]|nr:MAG: hypothetical protein DK306_000312 [Chloroflexota bacterium]